MAPEEETRLADNQQTSEAEAAEAKPRRRRRSTEEVTDRILEAAAEEFELWGYAGATTAAIARRAEVTEAQIFRFYGSKQDLFRAAIFGPLNRHFADFQAREAAAADSGGPMRDAASRYINELQDFMEQHSGMLMSLIVASAYTPGATSGVADLEGLRAYFTQGTEMMTRRMGAGMTVDPKLMVRVSFAAVLASVVFKDWLFPADMADDAAIREAIVEFVIDGIGGSGLDAGRVDKPA